MRKYLIKLTIHTLKSIKAVQLRAGADSEHGATRKALALFDENHRAVVDCVWEQLVQA